MSAISFRTTSKGGIPYHSFIFMKSYTLGVELKNAECSRLGTMLYLEMQRWKEAMKTLIFKQYIGGISY